ncbi:glycosyltransferase family 39 protein [Aeromicrobium sp. UC242_57]|uniref:glycosyltransferase family 39 protein n=1 Tax=Aeromicrobium sp. UC242_57 TaxID=3374624 RepID=UPI00378D13FD
MNQLSRPALERWRLVALLGPAALAAVVGFWSITVPSLWRDESVTVYFTDSSLGDALRDWGDQDAVHALYYLIARATAWIGPIEVGVRLPSVVAFALTALGIVLLGRRLSGQVAGTCAGVVYALIPVGSRYAQEARPYALVSAAAVFSTLALLRLSERLTKERFASYVLITTVLGYLNIYALLLLLAHGTYVLWEARAALRRVVPAWACSLVLLLPMILIGSSQSGQIGWIAKPGWEACCSSSSSTAQHVASTRCWWWLA